MDPLRATTLAPVAAPPQAAPGAGIPRRDILGIPMAMTDYAGAMDVMDEMVDRRQRGWVCAAAVHSVMVAQDDPVMRTALTDAVITVPDGMPIVWAANLLGEDLPNRVYGPELMRRYCDRSVERGHRVWLYGGRDQGALVQLALTLRQKHPGIKIVGGYSPPFRPLTEEEDDDDRRADQRGPAGRALGGHRRAQAGEVDGAHARPARRAGACAPWARRSTSTPAGCRRRRAGCRSAGWSGPTGSPRSRAGCCRATSTPTRASCSASRASGCASTPSRLVLRTDLDCGACPRAPLCQPVEQGPRDRLLAGHGRRRLCRRRHLEAHLAGTGTKVAAPPRAELDLLDAHAVRAAVAAAQPAVVFHLAAFSSPRRLVGAARARPCWPTCR